MGNKRKKCSQRAQYVCLDRELEIQCLIIKLDRGLCRGLKDHHGISFKPDQWVLTNEQATPSEICGPFQTFLDALNYALLKFMINRIEEFK